MAKHGRHHRRKPRDGVPTPPPATFITCLRCRVQHPIYGIIRRIGPRGQSTHLCFTCYEAETGGEYLNEDEYWDGHNWIPLSRGM